MLVVALVGASSPHAPDASASSRDGRGRGQAAPDGHVAPPAGRAGRTGRGDGRGVADGLPADHARLGPEVVQRVQPDDGEAPGGDDEREGRARRVHELALNQRHDRATDDRHHEAGRPELRRRPEARQGDPVDRREHQRQAERQRDDGDHAGHVRARHREQAQPYGEEGEHRKDAGRADVANHPGHEKAREQEDQEAGLQVGAALLEAAAQRLLHVDDQERPRAHLRRHVGELGDHAEAVALVAPQHSEQRARPALVRAGVGKLLDDLRCLLAGDREADDGEQEGEADVGAHHRAELARADRVQLLRRQRADVDRVGEPGQDQRRGEQHPDVRAHRIEGLGEVQAPRRRGLRAERHDVRVGGGLENRASRRHREQGHEERLVGHDLARRVEQESAEGRQREAGEDARLVPEALVDEGRRQREQKVGAEVRELHERRLERAHVEDALEARDHRGRQVLRDPPRGEARDQGDEQHQHALAEQRLTLCLLRLPSDGFVGGGTHRPHSSRGRCYMPALPRSRRDAGVRSNRGSCSWTMSMRSRAGRPVGSRGALPRP